jgi:hypothetical protein
VSTFKSRGCVCVAVATLTLSQAANINADETVTLAGVGMNYCDYWRASVRYPYDKDHDLAEAGLTEWALGYASAAAVYGGPQVFTRNNTNSNISLIDAISRRCKDFPTARIDAVIQKLLHDAP